MSSSHLGSGESWTVGSQGLGVQGWVLHCGAQPQGWLPASLPGAPLASGCRTSLLLQWDTPAPASSISSWARDLQPQGQEVEEKICCVNTALRFKEEVKPTGRLGVLEHHTVCTDQGLRGAPATTPTHGS